MAEDQPVIIEITHRIEITADQLEGFGPLAMVEYVQDQMRAFGSKLGGSLERERQLLRAERAKRELPSSSDGHTGSEETSAPAGS